MGSQRVGNNLAAGQQHSRRIDEIITDRTSRTGQGIQQSLLLYTKFYQHVCLQRWSFVPKKKKKHGLPRRRSDKESTYQCKRCKRYGFNPWIRKMPWRRTWQLTPIFLPGKFHEQKNLVGYSPWGCKNVTHNLMSKQQVCRYRAGHGYHLKHPWIMDFFWQTGEANNTSLLKLTFSKA